MSGHDCIRYESVAPVGFIIINNPPVNALGHDVRRGIIRALKEGMADRSVRALVLIGAGRTFPAGADIREFDQPSRPPLLSEVVDAVEAADKLTIAAIHGTALGGGMEITLGCDYRIVLDSAQMGLPEVGLGLLPGAGGTQRLPRLIGVKKALEFIVGGKPVAATELQSMGIVDRVVSGSLRNETYGYATELLEDNAEKRVLSTQAVVDEGDDFYNEYRVSVARRKRGHEAPLACVDAVRMAARSDFATGMQYERAQFMGLKNSSQSAALRHVFLAERAVRKVPGLSVKTPRREIEQVAVIGAGTMGCGIATSLLAAGLSVTLLEMSQDKLTQGVVTIRRNHERQVQKRKLTREQVDTRLQRLTSTLAYDDLADADLIIEAVFEDMVVKQEVFTELDRVARPGAILASNTSSLDINEIAAVTKRPADVLGLHFFSPAHIMKLVEIVRGRQTADDVLATVIALTKRMGKIGVTVGVCPGFVGNRILHQYRAQAVALVNEGATPSQVDRVLYEFGLPMGPFAMTDLAGLDIGWRIREARRQSDPAHAPARGWLDKLAESGRFGQKSGAGVFEYDQDARHPKPSKVTARLIADFRAEQGMTPRTVSDEEIRQRCLYVMVNESAKILEEGVASRPADIDIIWINGYGFPAYRGGVMFWADQIGLDTLCQKIRQFHDDTADRCWAPAPLLERLVQEGGSLTDLNKLP